MESPTRRLLCDLLDSCQLVSFFFVCGGSEEGTERGAAMSSNYAFYDTRRCPKPGFCPWPLFCFSLDTALCAANSLLRL